MAKGKPEIDRPLWREAIGFAARAHRHELRKDRRTPFVAHVFRVSMVVRDVFGCDDPVAITAALLHDTIEDTRTDYDDLHALFGQDVADVASALTKNMLMPEPQREEEYDARLARADWRARLIKLADTYDNLIDSFDRSDKAIRKAALRCVRAIKLAQPDAAQHELVHNAILELRTLLEQVDLPDLELDVPSAASSE